MQSAHLISKFSKIQKIADQEGMSNNLCNYEKKREKFYLSFTPHFTTISFLFLQIPETVLSIITSTFLNLSFLSPLCQLTLLAI